MSSNLDRFEIDWEKVQDPDDLVILLKALKPSITEFHPAYGHIKHLMKKEQREGPKRN